MQKRPRRKDRPTDIFAVMTRRVIAYIEDQACGQWVVPRFREIYPDMANATDVELIDKATADGYKVIRQQQRDMTVFVLTDSDGKQVAVGELSAEQVQIELNQLSQSRRRLNDQEEQTDGKDDSTPDPSGVQPRS